MKNNQSSGLFEYLLTHYRGVFAVVFLLPLSVVYDLYFFLRNKITLLLRSAPALHEERVRKIQQHLKQWRNEGAREKLCTARSGWSTMSELVPKYKKIYRNIPVNLRDVLEIDEQRRVVRVEPMVTMGQLTATLIPRGWTVPVVPELDDLTVGGLIMGFGVETSSHKYGLFQYSCEAFELLTPDGTLLRCSRTQNSELFYLIPWSHGTLGFLVAAELKIIPAKKYVRMHYKQAHSQEELVRIFEAESRNVADNDFVEALVFSQDKAVILCGQLTDEVPAGEKKRINPIGRWYKPWFYKHVEKMLHHADSMGEYIPLRHYYHRHTRSFFWEMEQIIPFGNHPVFRFLLGWAVPPKIPLLKYTQTETTARLRDRYHIVQDMLIPIFYLADALQYFQSHFDLYPLWLCPMAIYDNEKHIGFLHPFKKPDAQIDELYVDIGAYGAPRKAGFDASVELPRLEQFVLQHSGYQALYARTMLTRDQFRQMFDHSAYDKMREQLPLCEQAFDEVYEKVSVRGRTSPEVYRKMKKNKKTNSAVV
ncbi:MAG: hypothetical protein KatS3mg031_2363 [Chitinophagales bacterium]|nr:MAG: hypothetical protein KatS3mg031_2363 [Chitinophagales bacterium]